MANIISFVSRLRPDGTIIAALDDVPIERKLFLATSFFISSALVALALDAFVVFESWLFYRIPDASALGAVAH